MDFAVAIFSLTAPQAIAAPATRRVAARTDPPQAAPPADRRNGELLVRFRPETPEEEKNSLIRSIGAQRHSLAGRSGVERLRLDADEKFEAAMSALSGHLSVEFVEPNYLIKADDTIPDDAQFAEQWALRNTGESGGQINSDIGATRAWDVTTGSKKTIIAVIDSGIDFTHPDLKFNQWKNPAERRDNKDDDSNGLSDDIHGWDWVAQSNRIKDEQGHGTAIAGIIAAEGNNKVGISGVMWRAGLMSLRVLDGAGTGDVAQAVEAIDYAVAHGAQVLNLSWGTEHESRALAAALERAAQKGVLAICSAGNDGRNIDGVPHYPASYDLPNIVAVASTDNSDQLTSWSNWGGIRAALAAPGANILTTERGGGYRAVTGSSFSVPFVSGVAGLIRTLRPTLSAERTREMLVQGARRTATLQGKVATGGVVNAGGAAEAIQSLAPDEGREANSEEESAGNNRTDSGNSIGINGNGQDSNGSRREPVKGRPTSNLPDLNVARAHRPQAPRAPAPIPSRLRNCPPHNPRCNESNNGTSDPARSQSSASPQRPAAAERINSFVGLNQQYRSIFIAALRGEQPYSLTSANLPEIDYRRGAGAYSVSDASTIGGTWLPSVPDSGGSKFAATMSAVAAVESYAAAFITQSVPLQMRAGQTYTVSITMRNTGSTEWTAQNFYRLGSRNGNDNTTWRLNRVQLPYSVGPGAYVTFNFDVTAPTTPNTYDFQWSMVQDGPAEWFGNLTDNLRVNVVAPQYWGWLDAVDCNSGRIWGWAWDETRPDTPISVDLFDGDKFFARVVADQYRSDLAGYGGGRHAFNIAIPPSLRDGMPHSVSARYANSMYALVGSPHLNGSPGGNFTCALGQTPYKGVARTLPGIIEAEDFDEGGQHVAYYDTTPGNTGGQYRTNTDVDLGGPLYDAGGGYGVGWVTAGEWLKYTVNVATADTYVIEARVATFGSGATFHLEFDGIDRTGPITIPEAPGWGVWQSVTRTGVALSAGPHVMRVVMDNNTSGGPMADFNYFRIVPSYGWGEAASGTPVNGVWDYLSASSANSKSMGGGWHHTFRGPTSLTNYTVEAQARLVQTGTTATYPKYGIYAAYKDSSNFVVAFLDSRSGVFTTSALIKGTWQPWLSSSLNSFDFSQYHSIKAVKTGGRFDFYVDGILQQTRTFQVGSNQIGLVTEDTRADYANVIVTPEPRAVYSAVADFSGSRNPAYVWSYGYRAADDKPPTLFTNRGHPFGAGLDSWYPTDGSCCPSVTRNNQTQSITPPPDMLNVHPGPNGEKSVVTWTAPSTGMVQIEGRFEGIDNATTDVAVLYNPKTNSTSKTPPPTTLFSGQINGFGQRAPFSLIKAVTAGNTLEFSVGSGGNNTHYHDSTGLSVTIKPIANVVDDFSASQNPNGAWTYGSKASANSDFARYATSDVPLSGLERWRNSAGEPMVGHNNTGTTLSYATVNLPPDLLTLHPGPSGEKSVVRWTARAAGTMKFEGRFQGLDTGGTTTDVTVIHNSSVPLFSGAVNGYGTQTPFMLFKTVAAGDTIDFVVGTGGNNTYYGDSTGLAVTITPLETPATNERVWIEDALPAGAVAAGENEGWNWQSANPAQFSGAAAHQSNTIAGYHQHYFYGATETLPVSAGGRLFTYVYLDPANPPSEIMLQWNAGGSDGWDHRAYWGTNQIELGAEGTASRKRMGTLPVAGQWVRLEVPAGEVGLEGRTLNGMAFTLYGGRATWDRAGVVTQTPFQDRPRAVPGLIEAEDFDNGGQGVAYYDQDAGNNGGGYRSTDVDTWCNGVDCGIGWIGASEWLKYTLNVASSGTYTVQVRAGSPGPGGTFHIEIDGVDKTGPMSVPATGNWRTWATITKTGVPLSAGQHIMRIVMDTPGSNGGVCDLNSFNFVAEGDPTGNDFSTARLDPINRTGGGGEDLLSGNFNWGVPLLNLPGRAGLDLGLSLAYNSLVWTKDTSSSSIQFNSDNGFPAPGFRLGFPVIEPQYYNRQINNYAYLMMTPAGSRVELRRVGSSNIYEAADSSYLQLVDYGGTMVLRPTDGSQLTFRLINGEYQCTEVKDRNGNFITVSYDALGGITTIKDTLARLVRFNYDRNHNLLSITQDWGGQTHVWATFGYQTLQLQHTFSSYYRVVGPQSGQSINVLAQVGLADGSSYKFDYETWGQIKGIRRYSADNHQLAYTTYFLLPSFEDCPRPISRSDWAQDWNNGAEAVTNFSFAADRSWGQMTAPDGTRYKELFGTFNWQRGLTTGTEIWAGGAKQKYTTTEWTQDNEALSYQLNPRPKESHTYDKEGNRKRTAVSYTSYGLPFEVKEYAADAVNVLRRTETYYRFDSVYVDRRIIGLPSQRLVYDGAGDLVSKTAYDFDRPDWGGFMQGTAQQPVQHDAANYGSNFVAGRGNLVYVGRFDVEDRENWSKVLAVSSGYNQTGQVTFTRNQLGYQTSIDYTDSFSGGGKPVTYAYPTTVTDADNYSSTVQYNYDMGVMTRTQNPKGAASLTAYDGAGRVERVTNLVNNAYTRFVYAPGQNWVQTFTTIRDAQTESYSIQVLDGAGRVYASAGDFPGGTAPYRGQHTVYDVMGRAVRSSNPAAITNAWEPTGDDAAGWYYATQDYDWKGRPTYSTNPDGRMNQELIYGGCGCAGNEVVTVRDAAGRRQQIYQDVLGRVKRTDVLGANGSVYTSTVNTYNARDQIMRVKEYKGTPASDESCPTGNCQESEYGHDGYGRLKESHRPEQRTQDTNQPTWTQYSYNADDTTNVITDARGATTTFSYMGNKRGLVTE
jgi:YD repeat-containing protein